MKLLLNNTQDFCHSRWGYRVMLLAFIILGSLPFREGWGVAVFAQNCSTGGTPSVLVSWTFDDISRTACNGAKEVLYGGAYQLYQDKYKYCPTTNSGCGQALLGSKGHQNTGGFKNA